MTSELGEFIEARRRELGLSQAEVSKRTSGGLSHTTIANLEKGTDPRTGKPRHPRAVTLQMLAPVLETPYDQLAELAGYIIRDEPGQYKTDNAILDGRQLTEQEKAVIRALRESKKK